MARIIAYEDFIKLSQKEQRECIYQYLMEKLDEEGIKYSEGTRYDNTSIKELSFSGIETKIGSCHMGAHIFFNVNDYNFDEPGEAVLLRCYIGYYLDKKYIEETKAFADSWNASHNVKVWLQKNGYTYMCAQRFLLEEIAGKKASYNHFTKNIVELMLKKPYKQAEKAFTKMKKQNFIETDTVLKLRRDRFGLIEYFELKGYKLLTRHSLANDELNIKFVYHSPQHVYVIVLSALNGFVTINITQGVTFVAEKSIPEDEESAEVIEEMLLGLE